MSKDNPRLLLRLEGGGGQRTRLVWEAGREGKGKKIQVFLLEGEYEASGRIQETEGKKEQSPA